MQEPSDGIAEEVERQVQMALAATAIAARTLADIGQAREAAEAANTPAAAEAVPTRVAPPPTQAVSARRAGRGLSRQR